MFLLAFALVMMASDLESVAAAFESARMKCAYSIKEAAGYYGRDPRVLQRELSGIGHPSLKLIAQMPEKFVQWFALELVRVVGLPEEIGVAQQIAERVK